MIKKFRVGKYPGTFNRQVDQFLKEEFKKIKCCSTPGGDTIHGNGTIHRFLADTLKAKILE